MKINSIKKVLKISILMTVILALPIMYTMATENAISYTLSEDKKSAVIHLDVNKVIGENDLIEVKDQDNNQLTEYDITVTENGTYTYTVTYKEKVIKETEAISEELVAENKTEDATTNPDVKQTTETFEIPKEETVIKNEVLEIIVDGILSNDIQELKTDQVLLGDSVSTTSEETDASLFTFTPSTGTISNFSRISSVTNVVVPSEIDGVPVKIIGFHTFYNCDKIVSITLPDSVESIKNSAFSGCIQLTSIDLGKGIKNIDYNAFYGCTSLESIYIPDTVTELGEWAFYGCTGLKSVHLPEGIKSLNNYLFSDCESLQTITIPENVTTIGESTFARCTSLDNVLLPNQLTSLGFKAFAECTSLTKIDIPDSVTFMDRSVFKDCISLKKVKLPNKIDGLLINTFFGCSSLTDIVLPSNIQYIETFSFGICSNLENMTMSQMVLDDNRYDEEADYYPGDFRNAFANVDSLKKLLIIGNNNNDLVMNENQLSNLSSVKQMNPNLIVYRGTLNVNIEPSQDKVHSIKNVSRTINLEDVFKKEISQVIYKGEKGTELYTGNDVRIPDDYFDQSIQYVLNGTPTSSQTRIDNGLLYIGADETASDLKIGIQYNSMTQEVPITSSTINSIEIKQTSNTEYADGDSYNPKGLIITVHYEDGTTEDIEYNELTAPLFHFSDSQLSWDNKDIVIEFGGKSVKQEVEVYKDTVVSDETGSIGMDGQFTQDTTISNKPVEDNSELLDGLDPKQVIGEKEYIISGNINGDVVVSYDVGEKNNGKTVYIQYKDKNGEIKIAEGIVVDGKVAITITDPTSFIIYMDLKDRIGNIKIKTLPQTTYNQGEYYNPQGLSISIFYTDDTNEIITYNQQTKNDFQFSVNKMDVSVIKQIIEYKGIKIEHTLKVIPEYHETIIKDDHTNVSINGNFTEGSYPVIGKVENPEITKDLLDKDIIGQYEAKVVGEYHGQLFVTFDVGLQYNGKTVYIKHQKSDGSIEILKVKVINGVIGVNTDELGTFIIYTDKELEILPEITMTTQDYISASRVQESNHTSSVPTHDIYNLELYGLLMGVTFISYIFVSRKGHLYHK